jgi:hypothetical protein
LSRLTDAEIEQLVAAVNSKCDRPTRDKLARLLTESRELRDQAAERQFMYDIEPET